MVYMVSGDDFGEYGEVIDLRDSAYEVVIYVAAQTLVEAVDFLGD